MPTDNYQQTIQDSRKAAMSILESAKKKDEERNNRTAPFSRGGDTDTDVERRPRLANPDDVTDSAIEESIRNGVKGRRAARKAVDDFWRAAYRKADSPTPPLAPDNDSPIDIDNRIMEMSDEEFENAVASGELTPEQIRKAGEYAWDVYMGDVWSESHYADEGPEPTYDEFMADPEKYGYIRGGYEERDRAFDRYAKYLKKK